ncbi:MAG: alpha/beta hydrolase [Theionarchaea archaeon]|nr:alpha/beta hydrolase [Theionarchaea archaeon]
MNKNQSVYEKSIVYKISGMDHLTVHRNLIYKSAEGVDLKLDVYIPADIPRDTKIPGVMFIHGGPIQPSMKQPKDWGFFNSYGRLVAASGLVGVTFNHRYHSVAYLEESGKDIRDAISYIQDHSEFFNLDPHCLSAWIFSGAGRHLYTILENSQDFIKCVILYYPVLSVESLIDEMRRKFSPVPYFKKDAFTEIPIFFARAGLERPQYIRSVDVFIQKALEANICLDLANHPHGRHGFDILDDDDRSRQIIAQTIEFIKTNLIQE